MLKIISGLKVRESQFGDELHNDHFRGTSTKANNAIVFSRTNNTVACLSLLFSFKSIPIVVYTMHRLILNTLQKIWSLLMKFERSYCNARNLGKCFLGDINCALFKSLRLLHFSNIFA